MSSDGSANRPSKNERRQAARDKAKELRESQRRRDKRNRIFLQGGIGIAALAVVGIVVFVVASAVRPASPGPANMASDGIVIGTELKAVPTKALPAGSTPVATENNEQAPNIRVYLDYLCPICGQFEQANAELLKGWAESGAATIEYHPIAILTNRSAGTQYSLRAANAAACVADEAPDKFFDFNALLFKNQPAEGTAGLTDEQLKGYAKDAGVTDTSSLNSCVDDGDFKQWVKSATDRATNGPLQNADIEKVSGTPTILVNGKVYKGSIVDPSELNQFVLSTASADYSNASPSPEPKDKDSGKDEDSKEE